MGFQSKREFIDFVIENFFVEVPAETQAQMLASIGDLIPQPFLQFDGNGLKFPIEHLEVMSYQLLSFPLFIMSKYADIVTVNMVAEQTITKEIIGTSLTYKDLNATAIGNLAYISKYCFDPEVKKQARQMLLEFVKDFLEENLRFETIKPTNLN